jgi:hypothetical protein
MTTIDTLRHIPILNLPLRLLDHVRAWLRPRAVVSNGCVLCGSADTGFLDTVGHYASFEVQPNGDLRVDTSTFFADDGIDPHLNCYECNRSSTCPDFDWL